MRKWILTFTLVASACAGGSPESTPATGAVSFATAEISRIDRRLDAVAASMRRTEPAGLSPARRAARAETLRWLDAYRRREVYPHNHVLAGALTPVFVDPHGTPCAVAYLMLRSGETELVERVVREANLSRVPELAGDARMAAWLERRGITADEAARIQPEYHGFPGEEEAATSDYVGVTVGVSVLTAALASYAHFAPQPESPMNLPRLLSAAALMGHTGLMVWGVGAQEPPPAWAMGANIIGGLANAWFVTRGFSPAHADGGDAGTLRLEPFLTMRGERTVLGASLRW